MIHDSLFFFVCEPFQRRPVQPSTKIPPVHDLIVKSSAGISTFFFIVLFVSNICRIFFIIIFSYGFPQFIYYFEISYVTKQKDDTILGERVFFGVTCNFELRWSHFLCVSLKGIKWKGGNPDMRGI